MPDKRADQRLLDAIQAFVAGHPDPGVRRFRAAIAAWGQDWSGVTPARLPAAAWLAETLTRTTPDTHGLAALFERETASRKWEQSYSKADGGVGEDMLAGYGFAEIIGKRGPFVSNRVRAGIGVWGPGIDYPSHRHEAEEVYVLLGGNALFHFGGTGVAEARRAGDVVHVPSMRAHGFRTEDDPLAVVYIWQAGDLREKSTFC